MRQRKQSIMDKQKEKQKWREMFFVVVVANKAEILLVAKKKFLKAMCTFWIA